MGWSKSDLYRSSYEMLAGSDLPLLRFSMEERTLTPQRCFGRPGGSTVLVVRCKRSPRTTVSRRVSPLDGS